MPVFVTTAPISCENGDVIGGLETCQDVTTEMSALSQLEDLKNQSLICLVTGVGNRRSEQQTLGPKLEEAQRKKGALGLVFMDIDRFKPINDRFVHNVGDVALKMVARTLANAMRAYDFMGRWGGKEFIAILPNQRKPQLAIFAERLRALVEQSSATVSQGALVVTISAGAIVAEPDEDLVGFVARADALMYESKRAGRNRVTIG